MPCYFQHLVTLFLTLRFAPLQNPTMRSTHYPHPTSAAGRAWFPRSNTKWYCHHVFLAEDSKTIGALQGACSFCGAVAHPGTHPESCCFGKATQYSREWQVFVIATPALALVCLGVGPRRPSLVTPALKSTPVSASVASAFQEQAAGSHMWAI